MKKKDKPQDPGWHPGGHTPARITPNPKATNIPKGPAPGAPANNKEANT